MSAETPIKVRDVTNEIFEFETIQAFNEFIKNEAVYWHKQFALEDRSKQKVHDYFQSYKNLQQIQKATENFIEQFKELHSSDLAQYQQQLTHFVGKYLGNMHNFWLKSTHPFTSKFVECQLEYDEKVADAFFKFVNGQPTLGDRQQFLGTMIGYEFENQDSDITKRTTSEKDSLNELRNRLSESTNLQIDDVEKFKSDFNTWDSNTKENWDKWLLKSSGQHAKQIDDQSTEFTEYMKKCNENIEALEKTYEEHLKLAKPADYWNKSAKKYRIQSVLFFVLLVASVGYGLNLFHEFFSSWLQGQETAVKLNTVQGVVIFGTILTIYAFLLKTLSRLTFSSFHLMRDAEEREQLTYLYLSLTEESKIDESSRDIVLQALFSRTETGLLTSESGPTMPVAEVINQARQGR